MPAGIIILDDNFIVQGIDQEIMQLFGHDNKACYGQHLTFLIPTFNEQNAKDEVQAQNTKQWPSQGKTKKGTNFSLKYCLHPVTLQDKTVHIVTIDGVSSVFSGLRQRSVANNDEGQGWLTYLLHSSPVVIYSCRPSGDFETTFISNNIRTLAGYTQEQYLADPAFWLNHLHPEDKDSLLTEMSELFNGNESHSYEYRFLCADGSYIWVLDKLKISRDDQGNPIEMMGLWLDITRRKADEEALCSANEQLQQQSEALSESNTELSQFTYVVSHDLKAPLRAIHSYCDWLSEDMVGKLEPDQQEYITGMQDAVQQAEALIEDLLELSRVGRRAAQVEPIALSDFFKNLTASLITDDTVVIDITENMPEITVSPTVLTQVFQNLITNAAIYNTSAIKTIAIRGRKENDNYIVTVADNGIGIEQKFHERVFQLFQRLHTKEEYDGTGIGLAIVQKAVAHLNWGISLSSKLDQGSTFSITIPINEVKENE
jgi:PAS domain S-box-containing protein